MVVYLGLYLWVRSGHSLKGGWGFMARVSRGILGSQVINPRMRRSPMSGPLCALHKCVQKCTHNVPCVPFVGEQVDREAIIAIVSTLPRPSSCHRETCVYNVVQKRVHNFVQKCAHNMLCKNVRKSLCCCRWGKLIIARSPLFPRNLGQLTMAQ